MSSETLALQSRPMTVRRASPVARPRPAFETRPFRATELLAVIAVVGVFLAILAASLLGGASHHATPQKAQPKVVETFTG